MKTIDLNADVGEGCDDESLIAVVTSANVACGAHAGDDETMERAVTLAQQHGVAVGAHPGWPDPQNFGRVEMTMKPEEVFEILMSQIQRLGNIAGRIGTGVLHVKPHGAMYNQAAVDQRLAETIAVTVQMIHPMLRLVGLAGSTMIAAAQARRVPYAREAFADRQYRADGTLAPRGMPGAVIEDPRRAAAQALAIARGEHIETADGTSIVVEADTICCHGDTPGAVEIARAVRTTLEAAGVRIAPLVIELRE